MKRRFQKLIKSPRPTDWELTQSNPVVGPETFISPINTESQNTTKHAENFSNNTSFSPVFLAVVRWKFPPLSSCGLTPR